MLVLLASENWGNILNERSVKGHQNTTMAMSKVKLAITSSLRTYIVFNKRG